MNRMMRAAVAMGVAACMALPAAGEMATRRWGTPPAAASARGPRAAAPTGYAMPTTEAPAIDGKLDDKAWAAAPPMLLARTLDGSARAAVATEVRALQDGKRLYLAVRCQEPQAGKLRAERRGHDGPVWSDDSVEFFLGFGSAYWHFGVNAAGSTYDGQAKDGSWNSGIEAAAAKGEKEWTAEVAVPLAPMLGGQPLPPAWTANFNRTRYVTGQAEEFAWSPTGSGDSHAPDRFGKLIFSAPPSEPTAPRSPEVETLKIEGGQAIVQFDLSALPAGGKVYRAELLAFRSQPLDGSDDEAIVDVEVYPLIGGTGVGGTGVPPVSPTGKMPVPPQDARATAKRLELLGPWFDRFDVTEHVRQRAGKLAFFVKAAPAIDPATLCLDVAWEGKADQVPPQASSVRASHRAGQTFITWKEIEEPVGTDEIAWGQFRRILADLDKARRVRYCVYRSDKPITADTLPQAVRIAEVAPLSCWNVNGRSVDRAIDDTLANQYVLDWHQWNPFVSASVDGEWGVKCPMERLVIADGEQPLPRGTGLYVHTPGKAGKVYYAVVTSVDGVENARELSGANAVGPIAESGGAGEPLLQKQFAPKPYFNYRETRHHYVQWVAPPLCNLPSQYYNWGVGVPVGGASAPREMGDAGQGRPAYNRMPVELSLHRDGRSYARTQYRVEHDSLVLSPHDFPIKSWWYGYHESLGTLKSFRQGSVQPYTERRLLAFLDWAGRKWPVDRSRVLVTGCAGGAGGSGPIHLGIRHPKVFSLVLSGYGIPDYAGEIAFLAAAKKAGTLPKQLESIWGKAEWAIKADTGRSVWDELSATRAVREVPAGVTLPLVSITGRGMSRPTRDFFVAMLEAGQPVMGRFGVYGGGTLLPVSRTGTWTGMIRQDVRLDQSLPAFRGVEAEALWRPPKEPTGDLVVSDGMQWYWGDIGTGWRWGTDDLVDEPGRYEITAFWAGGGQVARPTATITLRRFQKFRLREGHEYTCEIRSAGGGEPRTMTARLEAGGTLTIQGIPISREGVRLIVKP